MVRARPAIQHVAAAGPNGRAAAIGVKLILREGMAASLVSTDRGKMVLGIGVAAEAGAAPVHPGIGRHGPIEGVKGSVILDMPGVVSVIHHHRVGVGDLGRVDKKDHEGEGPHGVHVGSVGSQPRIKIRRVGLGPSSDIGRRHSPSPAGPIHPAGEGHWRAGRRDRAEVMAVDHAVSRDDVAGSPIPPVGFRPHEGGDRHGARRKGDGEGRLALNIAGGPRAGDGRDPVIQTRGVKNRFLFLRVSAGLGGIAVADAGGAGGGKGWGGDPLETKDWNKPDDFF